MRTTIVAVQALVDDGALQEALLMARGLFADENQEVHVRLLSGEYVSHIQHALGRTTDALRAAEELFDYTKPMSAAQRAVPTRLLAVRLQDQQLRNRWAIVRDLLLEACQLAAQSHMREELAHSYVLLFDYSFCARDFVNLPTWQKQAEQAIERLEESAIKSRLYAHWFLSKARYDLTGGRPQLGYEETKKGLCWAKRSGDVFWYYTLMIQMSYAWFVQGKSKRHFWALSGILTRLRAQHKGLYQWDDMEQVAHFALAKLSKGQRNRRPVAMRAAIRANELACKIESPEMIGETLVLLVACYAINRDVGKAKETMGQARVHCRELAYDDLLQDLDKIESMLIAKGLW